VRSGRIVHHLKYNIGDAKNTSSSSASRPETLGRRIVERRPKSASTTPWCRSTPKSLMNGFSSHADAAISNRSSAPRGASASPPRPGEPDQAAALETCCEQRVAMCVS